MHHDEGKKNLSPATQEFWEHIRAGQKNWQCEDFACSQQKDVNDKTPTI